METDAVALTGRLIVRRLESARAHDAVAERYEAAGTLAGRRDAGLARDVADVLRVLAMRCTLLVLLDGGRS